MMLPSIQFPWQGDAPLSWEAVVWPAWVPQKVRQEIADFWGPKCGRRPRDYADSIVRNPAPTPALGERVRLRLTHSRWVEGRYVHAWNNIGRVVCDDGSVAVVSTCEYPNIIPPASPAPIRDPLFTAAFRAVGGGPA